MTKATAAGIAAEQVLTTETRKYAEDRAALVITTTQAEIFAVQKWKAEALRRCRRPAAQPRRSTDRIAAIAQQRLAQVGVNHTELRDAAQSNLEDIAARAEATYQRATTAAGSYSTEALRGLDLVRDQANDALDGILMDWGLLESKSITTLENQAASAEQTYSYMLARSNEYAAADIENSRRTAEAAQQAVLVAQGIAPAADAGMGTLGSAANRAKAEVDATTGAVQRLTLTLQAMSSAQLEATARMHDFDAAANRMSGEGGAFWHASDFARVQEDMARAAREAGGEGESPREPLAPKSGGARAAPRTTTNLNVNVNNAQADQIATALVTEMRHSGVRF